MNLVLDEAEEEHMKNKTKKPLGMYSCVLGNFWLHWPIGPLRHTVLLANRPLRHTVTLADRPTQTYTVTLADRPTQTYSYSGRPAHSDIQLQWPTISSGLLVKLESNVLV